MKRLIYLGTFIFCMSVLNMSCQSDTKAVAPKKLEGQWELTQAYRDGKETNTLENLYFNIVDENTMETNFFSRDEVWDVVIEDGKITRVGGADVVFSIVDHTDNSMALVTNFRQFEFRFDLKRTEQNANE